MLNKAMEAATVTKSRTGKVIPDKRNFSSIDEAVDAYKEDLAGAEKSLNRQVNYTAFLPTMAIGIMAVLLAVFLPHSGDVRGYDVLFYTSVAERFGTTPPERIYMFLALTGGVLFTSATIITREWLVLWLNWAFAGVGWWYSVFAIWMRQSRPQAPANDPLMYGEGPSFGLIISSIGLTILFASLSILLFRRSALQKAVAQARREEASKDEESLMRQQRLRTGLEPVEKAEIVDDRRARVRARRAQKKQRNNESSSEN